MKQYFKANQFVSIFAFGRSIKQKPNLQQKQEEVVQQIKIKSIQSKIDVLKPKAKTVFTQTFEKHFFITPEYQMAQSHIGQLQLPQDVLGKCRQVFSKYPIEDLRQASDDYMKLYQLLHARERPQSILVKSKRPFENTDSLAEGAENPSQIFLRKKGTSEETILKKNLEKKEQKQNNIDSINKETKEPIKPKEEVNKSLNSSILINYDQKLTVCNLVRKVPSSYAVGVKIMTELKKRFPLFKPVTHLDYGAGLGPWSWASNEIYNCQNFISIEPNNWMRKLNKFIKKDDPRFQQFETLSHSVQLPFDQYDLVTIAFVLEEINNPEVRLIVLQSLWQKVKPGGVMILCGPGSPMGFRFVNDFRNLLLGKAKILAPCPHSNQCPLSQGGTSWCHFEQKVSVWPKNVFPKNVTDNSFINEKYSFIAFQKNFEYDQEESSIQTMKQNDDISENLDTDQQKEEVSNKIPIVTQSQSWHRIMFPTLKKNRHYLMDLCTSEGLIERRIISKSHGEDGGYYELKRLKWGDLWRFPKWISSKLRKDKTKGKRLF